jgi:hypothetical protein
MPASDARADRGADRGDAAGASGVGPSRIRWELERAQVVPLPGRSAVCRALVRHGPVAARRRRRRREDYRRRERPRAMDLWQMDVMGRVFLADGARTGS